MKNIKIILIIISVLIFGGVLYFYLDYNNSDIITGEKPNNPYCVEATEGTWCPTNRRCQWLKYEYCPEYAEEFEVDDFDTCVASGNPVMESYPAQCRDKEGNSYTQYIGNELEKQDLIILDFPRPNQKISSPLVVTGQARGSWFFEADFPIVLTDWDGLIIAEGYASAQGDWMTSEFVKFSGELKFTKPEYKDNGTLIFQKANPSGLPENNDFVEIPIEFK